MINFGICELTRNGRRHVWYSLRLENPNASFNGQFRFSKKPTMDNIKHAAIKYIGKHHFGGYLNFKEIKFEIKGF